MEPTSTYNETRRYQPNGAMKTTTTELSSNIQVCANHESNFIMDSSHVGYDSMAVCVEKSEKINSQIEDKEIPKHGSTFREMSRNMKYLLLLCILSHFMSGLSISLLAPFYPQEAQRKGMSLTLIGVTFSLFPLMNFLLSPIIGYHMNKVGPKFMVISGIFAGGVCNILYGTLDKCPPGFPFIITSLMCRLVEGIGFTAYCVAIFTITSIEFCDFATTALSFLQTASELGLMLGPGVGGFLYELGGFGTPFYISGAVIVVNGIVLYKMMPNSETKAADKKGSSFSFLRSGLVIAALSCTSASSGGISFLEATLANHLAALEFSTSVIGLLFAIVPCLFVVSSPIYGYLIDVKGIQSYVIVIGQFFVGLGLYFIGPGLIFPFLQLNTWAVILGLVLFGATISGSIVSPFKFVFQEVLESGVENNADMHAAACSVLNSMYSFGAFVGPLIGNALIEKQGYRFGYTVIGTWNIAVSGMCLIIFLSRHYLK